MKKLLSMTIGAVALSSPALAADLATPVYQEVIVSTAPASSWTGFYLGANAGYGWGNLDWKYAGGGRANQTTEGGVIGGTAGYNFQTGNLLLGVEGDFGWADINGSKGCPGAGYSCRSELNSFGTLRARAGWASDRVLLYGTGGLAFGDQNIETKKSSGTAPPSGKAINGSSTTAVGWTAGVGAEYAFSRNWSGKLEWLYYDLGSDTYKVDFNQKVKAGQSGSIVRVGLNYRFN